MFVMARPGSRPARAALNGVPARCRPPSDRLVTCHIFLHSGGTTSPDKHLQGKLARDRGRGCGEMGVVLVVDEADCERTLGASILLGAGHKVLSAATEDQALTVLNQQTPIDLLFTE